MKGGKKKGGKKEKKEDKKREKGEEEKQQTKSPGFNHRVSTRETCALTTMVISHPFFVWKI